MMQKKFYKKTGFIFLIVIVFYLIAALIFFGVNVWLGLDKSGEMEQNQKWNIKNSLIQAIVPTLILVIFVVIGKRMSK